MSSSAGVRCIGWEGKLLRVGFRGFHQAQIAQLKSLAARGIFFTGPVLTCLADRPMASTCLFSKVLQEPNLRSADLNLSVGLLMYSGKFPIRLSVIPAECLDTQFVRDHKGIKAIIASRDDSNIPYPKGLNVKLSSHVGNTELAEKILPVLRTHIPKWMQMLPLEKGYNDPANLHRAPWEYVNEDIYKALRAAGFPLSVHHAEIRGKAVFAVQDQYATEIVCVEIDPLNPVPIW